MSNYDKYGYRQLLHAVEGQEKIDGEQTSQDQQSAQLKSVPVQVDRKIATQNQTTKNEPENPESDQSSQCPKLYVFISLFVVILIGFFAFRTLFIQNDSVIINDVKIQCSNSVPGMNLMARGVDITTFDAFPSNIRKTNNFRDALFEFYCDQNRTWTSPTGAIYNLADQVKTIQTIPNKPVYIKTSLIDDLVEFKKLRAAELGIETEAFGAFSMSNAFAEMVKQITISSKRVVEAWTSVSVVKINLLQSNNKNIQPSEAFLDFINNELPHHYEDAPEMYHKFIDTFGTHYFVSAKFGGIIYEETHLDSSYLFKTNESHILSQVKAKLFQQTTNLPQEGKKQAFVDETFIANSQTQLYHYGGLADLINDHDDTNNLAKWSDSVYESPWLFSGKLISIDNLITNSTIKSQVKKAIAHHLTKTYFKELKSVVDLMKMNLTETELNELKTCEKYLNGPKLEQNELNKIKQNIDDWFVRLQNMKGLIAKLIAKKFV